MNMRLISEQTHARNVGSITITDDDSEDNNWVLLPIVVKAYNSLGELDYTAGFSPDIETYEPLSLVPFGEIEDPLISQTIGIINGAARIAARMIN